MTGDQQRRLIEVIGVLVHQTAVGEAILALAPDSAILDSELVDRLIEFAVSATASELDPESDKQDVWLSTQYALFTGLPHKSGNEQLAILADLQGRSLLVSTLEQLSPADESAVETQLNQAMQSGDADMQMRVLCFILYSKSPLSKRSREHVSRLLTSPDKMVRSQAVGMAAHLRDPDILRKFVETGWDARALDLKADHYVIWYGSSALLRAAVLGILDPTEAVDRIAVGFYGFALSELPGAGAKAAATRIDAALKRAANITEIPEFPLVEQPVLTDSNQRPHCFLWQMNRSLRI